MCDCFVLVGGFLSLRVCVCVIEKDFASECYKPVSYRGQFSKAILPISDSSVKYMSKFDFRFAALIKFVGPGLWVKVDCG